MKWREKREVRKKYREKKSQDRGREEERSSKERSSKARDDVFTKTPHCMGEFTGPSGSLHASP